MLRARAPVRTSFLSTSSRKTLPMLRSFSPSLVASAFALVLTTGLAGCTNGEAGGVVGSDEAALAATCSSTPSTREVVVDLESLAGLECRAIHGAFVFLAWEGRTYSQYTADMLPVCDEQIGEMRNAAWEHHGLRGIELTRCRSEGGNVTVERDLVLESKWTLRSVSTEGTN